MALTKQDEKTVKKIVRTEIDQALDIKLKGKLSEYPTRKELFLKLKEYPNREELFKHLDLLGKALSDKFESGLQKYPTKDELFRRLDHIVGELETIRQEQILTAHSQTEFDDRLLSVEKKLNIHASI